MKKKWIAMLIALVIMLSTTSQANYSQQEKTADALNELGLFLGTGEGYELDKKLTRAEGITLLVRMIGKEWEAQNWTLNIPFIDVPLWAIGYVGYAQQNGITNGTGQTTFSPNTELSDCMFLTLVLRALGYSDQGANATFVWNDPYVLAERIGLINEVKVDTVFTRGDAIEVFWKAMDIKLVNKNTTMAQSLIAQGIFTNAEFEAAEQIWKNGRKESAGTPILRPETSNNNIGIGNGTVIWQDNTEDEIETICPWEERGAKQPEDYTWAEFEALTGNQQLAFQSAIGGYEAFDRWMNKAQGNSGNNTEY